MSREQVQVRIRTDDGVLHFAWFDKRIAQVGRKTEVIRNDLLQEGKRPPEYHSHRVDNLGIMALWIDVTGVVVWVDSAP